MRTHLKHQAHGHLSERKEKKSHRSRKVTWQRAQRLLSDLKPEPRPSWQPGARFFQACQSPVKQASPKGHLYRPLPREVIQPALNVEAWGFKIHYLMLIRKKKTSK